MADGRRYAPARVAVVAAALLAAACRLASHEPVVTPAADHAFTSASIKAAMASLDRIRPDRLPQELDVPALRRRRLDEIAAAAGAMARAADAIPEGAGELSLDDAERAVMVELALRLRTQATTLEERARRDDARGVETLLAAIDVTCNRCHAAFRRLPLTER